METYIIRIYRFEKDNPRGLVGIVESVNVEGREKRAFTSFDDLWEILNSRRSGSGLRKQGKPMGHVKASGSATPVDVMKEMKTTIDARKLSRAERILLTGYAIQKVCRGEIEVLADDDHAGEDVSHTAGNHKWMLKGVESEGDCCRITISKH